MSFILTDEQAQFKDMVARFCRDKSPITEVRRLMDTELGYDPAVWTAMSQELGLTGLHVDQAFGGAGFGAVELAIVMEEFGRCLMCAPYFSSAVLCATAVAQYGQTEVGGSLITGLVNGSTIGTLATSETDGAFLPQTISTTATSTGDGYTLQGRKQFVTDGVLADVLVVLADSQEGIGLFVVEGDAPGVTRNLMQTMDATRKLAEIELSNVQAQRLSPPGNINLEEIYNLALVALANEMIGGAQALLDAAVAYTKMRVQFGRTIGSFQAIKHRLADLLLEVESAKSAAYQAAQCLAEGVDTTEMASLAKASANEAYLNSAIACIQLHGGIGFTWENDSHLWFKRAKSSEVYLGSTREHHERMLQAMGI